MSPSNAQHAEGRQLITPEDAARRLGLDAIAEDPKRIVLGMARRGEIRPVRVSKWTMIDAESVEKFIAGK